MVLRDKGDRYCVSLLKIQLAHQSLREAREQPLCADPHILMHTRDSRRMWSVRKYGPCERMSGFAHPRQIAKMVEFGGNEKEERAICCPFLMGRIVDIPPSAMVETIDIAIIGGGIFVQEAYFPSLKQLSPPGKCQSPILAVCLFRSSGCQDCA